MTQFRLESVKPIESAVRLLHKWAMTVGGSLLRAEDCALGVSYRCPHAGCSGTLRVRAADSEHVQPHLYHSDIDCAGLGESAVHALAKRVVAQSLREWIAGIRPAPTLWRRCRFGHESPVHAPFAGAALVEVEGLVCSDGVHRRADVLIHGPGLAIEVVHSHSVDEAKAMDLARCGVNWVELHAASILGNCAWVFTRGTLDARCELCRWESTLDEARLDAAGANDSAAGARAELERLKNSVKHEERRLVDTRSWADAELKRAQERVERTESGAELRRRVTELEHQRQNLLRQLADKPDPPPPGRRLRSKYDTHCKVCHDFIESGDPIVWVRGAGTAHPECDSRDPEWRRVE